MAARSPPDQLVALRECLRIVGEGICDTVRPLLRTQSLDLLSSVAYESKDDTIYHLDKQAEDWLVPTLEKHAAKLGGLVVIAEGLSDISDPKVFPEGMTKEKAQWRVLIDPIDGTRGIMYDKRSAFFLAGAGPNNGDVTSLQDLNVAVMVEIPTSRQNTSDTLTAIRGFGTSAQRRNLDTGKVDQIKIRPSQAKTIQGGFATLSRFFPPGKKLFAEIEEELAVALFPPDKFDHSKTLLFEDQYISSGGQMYELLMGHDRFVADVRAAAFKAKNIKGLTVHPYDVAAHLIGAEAGVKISGLDGQPLDCPLTTTSGVNWVGYANQAIKEQVEPVFLQLLRNHGILEAQPAKPRQKRRASSSVDELKTAQ